MYVLGEEGAPIDYKLAEDGVACPIRPGDYLIVEVTNESSEVGALLDRSPDCARYICKVAKKKKKNQKKGKQDKCLLLFPRWT